MGLGKTLTMISLILKHRELEEEREIQNGKKEDEKELWLSKKSKGFVRSKATLVICPASLLSQWEGEVKRRVKSGAMRVHVYHGTSRGQSAKVAKFGSESQI